MKMTILTLTKMTKHFGVSLTLGKAHVNMALPSLNRSLDHFDQMAITLWTRTCCNYVRAYTQTVRHRRSS